MSSSREQLVDDEGAHLEELGVGHLALSLIGDPRDEAKVSNFRRPSLGARNDVVEMGVLRGNDNAGEGTPTPL
jgi:hypothetical protein